MPINICIENSVTAVPNCGYANIVISNGVFNLVPDKDRALGEVLRILRPGGRFMLADQVLTGHLPLDIETRIENWAG